MIYALLAICIFFHTMFFLAIKLKNNSIVDIGWGIGFVIVDVMLLLNTKEPSLAQLFASVLILIWGLRLSGYIFWRNNGNI